MKEGQALAKINETISNYMEAIKLAELKLELLDKKPERAYHDGKLLWSWWTEGGKKRSEGRASVESARDYINTDIEIFTLRKGWAERIRSLATYDGSAYISRLRRVLHSIPVLTRLAYELLTYDVRKEHELSRMYRNSMVIDVGMYLEKVPTYTALELVE